MATPSEAVVPNRGRASVAMAYAAALGAVVACLPQGASGASGACVLVTELTGIVNAGTASQLEDAVAAAERERCDALLVRVDTPGGMLEQTRAIVRVFLGARIPIIAHVGPRGARAGSAGVFVVLSAHIAAMAPGTVIGAAHPVTGTGQDPEKVGGEHLAAKIENDTAAFARSIAEERGRNVEWSEAAVRESVSATAKEALDKGVIDHIAADVPALFAALEGQTVMLDTGPRTLALSGARQIDYEPTLQQRALAALGHPNLAYVLLMLGILGLVVEFHNPGMLIPGALGVLFLLLAAIGLNLLPVDAGGLLLLVIAAGLLVAEMYIASFGLLTLAAAGCLLLGSALLIDTSEPSFFAEPDVRVSWGAIVPLALALAGGSFALAVTATRASKRHGSVGAEGLVGEHGEVRDPVTRHAGSVFVHGERWRATSPQELPAGAQVKVVKVDGLTLEVAPAEEESI